MVDDGAEPSYEAIHFFDISSKFEYISGLTTHQCKNGIEPTALVAQVSYGNGDGTTSWIIDSGITHRMNGFANEFLDMTLEGYDDGLLVKGLVSGTKAYGIVHALLLLLKIVLECFIRYVLSMCFTYPTYLLIIR